MEHSYVIDEPIADHSTFNTFTLALELRAYGRYFNKCGINWQ
jgi:hypothetical protein